jgi:hypothetical protein
VSPISQASPLVEIIEQVLRELGAIDNQPAHRGRFCPIIERRWKDLNHVTTQTFDQQVSAYLHRHCSDSSRWKRGNPRTRRDLFKMHREGYWSVRSE